jgi:hypothetical protein
VLRHAQARATHLSCKHVSMPCPRIRVATQTSVLLETTMDHEHEWQESPPGTMNHAAGGSVHTKILSGHQQCRIGHPIGLRNTMAAGVECRKTARTAGKKGGCILGPIHTMVQGVVAASETLKVSLAGVNS